jgi:hypothetical protein
MPNGYGIVESWGKVIEAIAQFPGKNESGRVDGAIRSAAKHQSKFRINPTHTEEDA